MLVTTTTDKGQFLIILYCEGRDRDFNSKLHYYYNIEELQTVIADFYQTIQPVLAC